MKLLQFYLINSIILKTKNIYKNKYNDKIVP